MMKTLQTLSLLALLSLAACGPGRPDLRTIELNREGNKALTAQTYPVAMDKYIQALTFDPFVGALHLNLGLSFEGQQQAEQAMRSYKEAENLAVKENNLPLVFMARFNQAQLLGKAKKIDEALAMYQKALEIVPTSIETKTNIELLTQGQGGQGGDQNQDQKDQGDDKKDQKGGQGQDQKDDKDKKDQKDQKDSDKDDKDKKDDKPKQMQQSAKYKPRPFNGKDLSESDVKKILGELKQQEERIRAEYNKKDGKEQPRDKDW
jgi:tetratricopeptide (TPR) repeat protein